MILKVTFIVLSVWAHYNVLVMEDIFSHEIWIGIKACYLINEDFVRPVSPSQFAQSYQMFRNITEFFAVSYSECSYIKTVICRWNIQRSEATSHFHVPKSVTVLVPTTHNRDCTWQAAHCAVSSHLIDHHNIVHWWWLLNWMSCPCFFTSCIF